MSCSRGPTLDEAIRDFLEVQSEAARESCACYHLFIDLRNPEPEPYTSEQDCLAAAPTVTNTAADCIAAVLESGPYSAEENIEIMQCYQAVSQEIRMCSADKLANSCESPTECAVTVSPTYDSCARQLSPNQQEAIFLCATE